MKLYIWEKAWNFGSDGIAFALAGSLEEAKKLITDNYNIGCKAEIHQVPEFLAGDPKIYDTPVGHIHWSLDYYGLE